MIEYITTLSIPRSSKYIKTGSFGLKRKHLATLEKRRLLGVDFKMGILWQATKLQPGMVTG
jgi:hypothetical protein